MASPKSEFRNKNILITGAGRGIGKRIALGFAKTGARIGLLGRSKAEIDLAHIEIEQAGGSALRVLADVTEPEQLKVAVNRVRVVFGSPVDVLICAAAISGPLDSFLQTPLKAWTETIQINLLGVVHSCRAVLPSMIEKRAGKIIVLACDSDSIPKLNFSAYTTSKSAVARFVEALAVEMLDHNVQVNCLDPDRPTPISRMKSFGRKSIWKRASFKRRRKRAEAEEFLRMCNSAMPPFSRQSAPITSVES